MYTIPPKKRNAILKLRMSGKSIPEISRETGIAITTVQRHAKTVSVPVEFQERLKEKQGGSKERAAGLRAHILTQARSLLQKSSSRDYLFLLFGLYWGEGTKGDFSIMNSDPYLIQAFIFCILKLGIQKPRLRLSVRVHSTISPHSAIVFWSRITGLPRKSIGNVEVIAEGKKKGKLPFGMCRVRVKSGIRERLLIQSAITLIGEECRKRVLSTKGHSRKQSFRELVRKK